MGNFKKYVRKVYGACVLLACVAVFCAGSIITAYSREYEVMDFDGQGRLSFTMRDNPAIHTAYKTIAWTLKKYDLPIDHPDNLTITLQLEDESYLGDDGYMHTTIYVERQQILDKVALVSEDWLEEIRRFGSVAYLDNIMTVAVDGTPLGYVDENGGYHGEVYDTYEGIAGARGWKNPEDLEQYFGRKVALPADEPVYEPTPETVSNTRLTAYYNFNAGGISIGRTGRLYSDEYDVQQAVPVLEAVNAEGEFSSYAYRLDYMLVQGTRKYGVLVTVGVDLEWEDSLGNEHADYVEYSDWYEVERDYSYYIVDSLDFYALTGWQVDNDAIGSHWISNASINVPIRTVTASITDPEYDGHVWYYAGTYEDVPDLDLQWLAESKVGGITTTSDELWVGTVGAASTGTAGTDRGLAAYKAGTAGTDRVLAAYKADAAVPDTKIFDGGGSHLPSADGLVTLKKEGIPIKTDCGNVTYATESSCVYGKMAIVDGDVSASGGITVLDDTDSVYFKKVLVNPITIHTPVVCDAFVTDDKADNQRVSPDVKRASLVLGKNFSVSVGDYGNHVTAKGYGARDYGKYAALHEVCFPFQVVEAESGNTVPAFTWISIDGYGLEKFRLPITVDEGDYEIAFRTVAVNAQAAGSNAQAAGSNAQTEGLNAQAAGLNAQAIGSNAQTEGLNAQAAKGMDVTGNDGKDLYGIWEYCGYNANLDSSYYVAAELVYVCVSGQLIDFSIEASNDPVWQKVLSQGSIKSVGLPMGMKLRGAALSGGYSHEDLQTIATEPLRLGYEFTFGLTCIGNMADGDYIRVVAGAFYSGGKGERREVDLYQVVTDGGEWVEIIPIEMELGQEEVVCIEKTEDGHKTRWQCTWKLPKMTIAVRKGLPLEEIDESEVVNTKDGVLVLNFDITSIVGGAEHLNYGNLENAGTGYCNMWKEEGFVPASTQTDYVRNYGDVVLYSANRDYMEDYVVVGTH